MNVYGRAPPCHGLYVRVYEEKSFPACVRVHGWHRRYDGHDHARARKYGHGCGGDGACGYALVSRACDYVRAHGHGREYGRVRGGACLHS